MKTLSDFKRSLIPGSTWKRKHVQEMNYSIVKVACVNTVSVGFENLNGKITWLYFPKASEFSVNSRGQAEIYWPKTAHDERKLCLTYEKV